MSLSKTIMKSVNGALVVSDKLAGAIKEAIFGNPEENISERLAKGFSKGLLNAFGPKYNKETDLIRKYVVTVPMIVPASLNKKLIFALQQAQQARIVVTMINFFRTKENFNTITNELDVVKNIKKYMENDELLQLNQKLFSEVENKPTLTIIKESSNIKAKADIKNTGKVPITSHIYNSAYAPISIVYGPDNRTVKIGLKIVSYAISDEEIIKVLSDFTNKFSNERGFKSFLKGERSFMDLLFATDYITLLANVTKIMGMPWVSRLRKGTYGTSLAITMDIANTLKYDYDIDLFNEEVVKITVNQLSIFDMYIIDESASLVYVLDNINYKFNPYDIRQVYRESNNIIKEAKIVFTNNEDITA